MKNFLKNLTAFVAIITSAIGCQKFEITDPSMIGGVLTIHVGEYHLVITDSEKECVLTSSDPNVANSFNSYIYGVAPGTCTVTCKSGTVKRTVEVVVLPTDVMGFKFDTHEISVVPGFSSTFNVIDFDPIYASADMLTWGFANTFPFNDHFSFSVSGNTVSVSADDTTPSNAEALLTARGYKGLTEDGVVEVGDDIRIHITDFSIQLDRNKLTLEVGDTQQLEATVNSSADIHVPVSWNSLDSSVATCTDGLVEAVGEGETTITATAGAKTTTCTVVVMKKRNLPADYKIRFYGTCSDTGNGYLMFNDPITTLDVVRGGKFRSFYVGAEDGLPVPEDENGKGCTVVYTNDKIYKPGQSYVCSYALDFAMSASETSGSVTVTAPNGSTATLRVNGVVGSVTLLSPSGEVYSTVTKSGATIDLDRPTDSYGLRCCFAVNLRSSYDASTSYRIDFNDPGYLNLTCVQDSEISWNSNSDRWFNFAKSDPKKVYEFHIVDPSTGGSKFDYVVKINLK